MTRLCLAWLLLLCSTPSSLHAQSLTIAAASDLQGVMPEVVDAFERATGGQARVVFGSSGNFFTQIANGAPFDLCFSADIDYPQRLEKAGLTTPGTLFEYATGRLVLWSLKGTPVDLGQGLRALLAPSVRRVAIVNPDHAPYGRAAVDALKKANVYEKVRRKFVLGENVSQAAQFAESGNAEAGLLPLALATSASLARSGAYFEIPATLYAPIEQADIVLKASRRKDAARAFVEFLKRPDILQALRDAGFGAPPRR